MRETKTVSIDLMLKLAVAFLSGHFFGAKSSIAILLGII
jgi:hypothetical protein